MKTDKGVGKETVEPTTFEIAILTIETATCDPDPGAPSCNEYRLRPSEEAALLLSRALNPPPPWGVKINLARSFLGPEKCIILGKKLILNKTLTYLDLSMCDMQADAAEQFFSCVARNTTLKHLSVNGNDIGDRGAFAAAPCLARLETFHCASNGVTDVGASALAEALRHSATLKTLSLRNNRITVAGVKTLLNALEAPEEEPGASDKAPQAESDSAAEHIPAEHSEAEVPVPSATSENTVGLELRQPGIPEVDCTPAEPVFNETLHTLWVDQNESIPEEVFEKLATILAKRFPKPPETKKKKKKSAVKKG